MANCSSIWQMPRSSLKSKPSSTWCKWPLHWATSTTKTSSTETSNCRTYWWTKTDTYAWPTSAWPRSSEMDNLLRPSVGPLSTLPPRSSMLRDITSQLIGGHWVSLPIRWCTGCLHFIITRRRRCLGKSKRESLDFLTKLKFQTKEKILLWNCWTGTQRSV